MKRYIILGVGVVCILIGFNYASIKEWWDKQNTPHSYIEPVYGSFKPEEKVDAYKGRILAERINTRIWMESGYLVYIEADQPVSVEISETGYESTRKDGAFKLDLLVLSPQDEAIKKKEDTYKGFFIAPLSETCELILGSDRDTKFTLAIAKLPQDYFKDYKRAHPEVK
ncbi:MAG TPA: hypothetical protein VN937_24795 [Blastocatellia bacterium]|nr:hypothetical protein [Blastocatellia bacterium]